MSAEMRKALTERRELIQQRAESVLDQAITERQEWALALGVTPAETRAAAAWKRQARTVAAYRDRYGITTRTTLGPAPDSDAQKIDATRAKAALAGLQDLRSEKSGGQAQVKHREEASRGL